MGRKGYLYFAGDSKRPTFVECEKTPPLAKLQELVGGWIEGVPCDIPNVVMYCNEEGKFNKDFKPTLRTSMMFENDFVVGPVVCLGDVHHCSPTSCGHDELTDECELNGYNELLDEDQTKDILLHVISELVRASLRMSKA